MRRIATALTTLTLLVLLPAQATGAEARMAEPTPRDPGKHSIVYREQRVINADAARVWTLLVDLPGYARWNPWVIRADGLASPGATVNVDVVLGGHVLPATHTILVTDPYTRFCWRDAGWNALFVYGQRCRTLQVQPDGRTLYTSELLLDGVLTAVADRVLGQAMRDGMAAEATALKDHAETPVSNSLPATAP
ncbi:SRPBCC domain-containing protein [Streptomyces sp. NPDC091376]|uniref:SRPBCC domain-containing protein n=1 Tax=Streptomyces sp. NPDC091376 TaxID=3365994 RepID=UPI00380C2403